MNLPFVIALTGSIGMGKTTTAAMFAELGVEVWGADSAVHKLYAKGGAAVSPIGEAFPDSIVDGTVDRTVLSKKIAIEPTTLSKLNEIVHPLVAADRESFRNETRSKVILLDIPLLFEAGADKGVDMIVVVSTTPALQQKRVLSRPGMTEKKFRTILAKQMPDAEKRKRADFVIDTTSLESAQIGVNDVMTLITNKLKHA